MIQRRASALAVGLASLPLLAAAACTYNAPAIGDKAGGGEPSLTLRLATPDPDGGPESAALKYFAVQAADHSSGRLQIEIQFEAVGDATDFEAATIEKVRDGTLDLGWVGARAWHSQGVRSLDALQAPFLIDSYPLLDRVVSGTLVPEMLSGLRSAGFVGLGAYPQELRHPIGFRKPFLRLPDFAGARFRVPSSDASDELVRALGAIPVHANGAALSKAISDGQVDGAESSVGNAGPFPARSFMTSNLTFYPKTTTLFMAAQRYSSLSANARAALDTAAQQTLALTLAADPESQDVTAFCGTGGTLALAAVDDLAAIVAAGTTAYGELEKDAGTSSMIQQIKATKASVSSASSAPSLCPGRAAATPGSSLGP
ncbi:MAG TPA: TRAP transporter substrate-binding protein DctP [Candidatus Limnocylindrales bacterium]